MKHTHVDPMTGLPMPDPQSDKTQPAASADHASAGRVTPSSPSAILAEIERILFGIDREEVAVPEGWWETSEGAKFGAQKLAEIRALFASQPVEKTKP